MSGDLDEKLFDAVGAADWDAVRQLFAAVKNERDEFRKAAEAGLSALWILAAMGNADAAEKHAMVRDTLAQFASGGSKRRVG